MNIVIEHPWLIAVVMALLLLGMLLGWWLANNKARRDQQLLMLQHQHDQETQRGIEVNLLERNQELEQSHYATQQQLEQQRLQVNKLSSEMAGLKAQQVAERESYQQQIVRIEAAEARLGDTFKRLASEIFEQKQKLFTENSKQQINTLIDPLNLQINDFSKLVREVTAQGNKQHGELQQKLLDLQNLNQNLSQEASQLVEALRGSNKMIGNWGELQLEKILQMAGLRKDHEYQMQVKVTGKDKNRLYPDALVLLPDGKSIVIDAKVSLEHYTRACHADNETERQAWMKQHCDSLRAHIKGLSGKDYTAAPELDTPDFVFMFVPVEAALQEALLAEPGLMDIAVRQHVVLAAPTTLLSSLRTVGSVWQAWRQNENAREIGERAGFLYDKFVGFVESMQQIGSRLTQAQSSYDDALKKLSSGRGNLMVQTEKLRELGAKTSKRLALNEDNDSAETDLSSSKALEELEEPRI